MLPSQATSMGILEYAPLRRKERACGYVGVETKVRSFTASFQKFNLEKMSPDPGRFEPSKGVLERK